MTIKCSYETCSDCLSFIVNGNKMPEDCIDTIKVFNFDPNSHTVLTARIAHRERVRQTAADINEVNGLASREF